MREVGGRTLPFDDVAVMREALEARRQRCGLGDELRLTLEWAADAVAGDIRRGDPGVRSGTSSSIRGCCSRAIFVALRGDRDGHDFVNDAFGRGAGGDRQAGLWRKRSQRARSGHRSR